ncbi:MAG: hypothetical protein J3Q66DRAFT_389394 [Benniella sp.]|nr:MAG: hypothetical protein J3Q66DRAFT_389394 [Benniella sp.]
MLNMRVKIQGSLRPQSRLQQGNRLRLLCHQQQQRPKLPKIIIPDGTSISLSTPPTTPRNNSPTSRARSKENVFSCGGKSNEIEPTERIQTGVQSPRGQAGETNTTMGRLSSEEQVRDAFVPEYGIMGLQFGRHYARSLSSNEKDLRKKDDNHIPGGCFSRDRYRYLFRTRPGLIWLLKHVSTILLGTIIIAAIGMTASEKFRDRHQVSDNLPRSLEGVIMEAQIVVIEDFDRLPMLSAYQKDLSTVASIGPSLNKIKVQPAIKVPLWTGPVQANCFHEKCDIEHFGDEYFGFMNPESFGIGLSQNWPSLCNSCIEITRNQFIYTTRIRMLGDLLFCPAHQTAISNPAVTEPDQGVTASTASPIATLTPPNSTPGAGNEHKKPTPPPTKQPPETRLEHKRQRRRPTQTSSNTVATSQQTPVGGRPGQPASEPLQRVQQKHADHQRRPVQEQNNPQESTPRHPKPDENIFLKPLITIPSRPGLHSRQDYGSSITFLNNTVQDAEVARLPYLIVDPVTFSNLTVYETSRSLQNMNHLRVHFRFVLCDS